MHTCFLIYKKRIKYSFILSTIEAISEAQVLKKWKAEKNSLFYRFIKLKDEE